MFLSQSLSPPIRYQAYLVLLLVLLSNSVSATTPTQVQADDSTEHIVVSGTRTPKLLSNSPVSVDVIDGAEIAMISQGTLAQALDFIPGVVVTRNVKDGYNVQMQGFDGDHVLVLIDGQPIISPTGSAADLDQINANDIAQIEIVRGAGSVLYGSSAMGGVINIISKKDSDYSAKISYELANYSTNQIKDDKFAHQIRVNANPDVYDWQTKINLLAINNPGFDYQPETPAQTAASIDKTFFDISANREFSQLGTNLKLQSFSEEKRRDSASIPGQSKLISYISDVRQTQFDLGFYSVKNAENWQLNSRYIRHTEISGQSNSQRKAEISLAEIDGQKIWSDKALEIVTGVIAHLDSLDQYKPTNQGQIIEVNDESRESLEAYLQSNWIHKTYQLLAGIRVQNDSDFGWHSALRVGAMNNYQLSHGQLQWRLGLGQSYRVPNLKERFYRFDHSNLGYMVLGNDQLEPETSDSLNTTVTLTRSILQDSADLELELNLHYSRTDNLIETLIDPEASTQASLDISNYQNIAQADIMGLDFSSQISHHNWRYQFNYSYLDSQDNNDLRLTERPRHQIKTNLSYSIPAQNIDLLIYWLYQADEAISQDFNGISNNSWSSFNFSVLQTLDQHISWRFGIDNLLDEHKDEQAIAEGKFDARPTSSRRLYLGASYQF